MKTITLFLFSVTAAWAQNPPASGLQPVSSPVAGGTCTNSQPAFYSSADQKLYTCFAGVWTAVSGGGSPSVGTTLQQGTGTGGFQSSGIAPSAVVTNTTTGGPTVIGTFPNALTLAGSHYLTDYASMGAALTAIGSTATSLVVNKPTTITTNTTFPSTLTLIWQGPDNLITCTGSPTLTINGAITAGNFQIFGSGCTTVIPGQNASAAWWGCVGDGATDNSTCLATLASLNTSSVTFQNGTYNYTTGPVITNFVNWGGQGYQTVFNYTGSATGGGVGLTWNAGQNYQGGWIHDFYLQGPGVSGNTIGILAGGSAGAYGLVVERVTVTGFNIGHSYASNAWNVTWRNVTFVDNGSQGKYPTGITNSGENIEYDHCILATHSTGWDSPHGYWVNGQPQGGIQFIGTSFDNIEFEMDKGVVTITQGHFEDNNGPTMTTPFVNQTGGALTIQGTNFIVDGGSLYTTAVTSFITQTGGSMMLANILPTNFSGLPNLAIISSTSPGVADISSLANYTASGVSQFVLPGSTGTVLFPLPSAVQIAPITASSTAPASVTATCTGTCVTSYSYTQVPIQWDGSHAAESPATSISNGGATLSGTVFNTIVTSCPVGAYSINVKRTVGGTSQGIVGNANCGGNFVDVGYTATTQATLTTNTTGGIVPGVTYRNNSIYIESAAQSVLSNTASNGNIFLSCSESGCTDTIQINGAGVETISGSGHASTIAFKPNILATTITGTSGTAVCSMNFQGTLKIATCYLNGYAQTGSAQTYNFSTAFSSYPFLGIGGATQGTCGTFNPATTASTLTLPANAAMTAETCTLTLIGQ